MSLAERAAAHRSAVAPAAAARRGLPGRLLELATFLLPGALLVYLSFNAGGFFPGTTAIVAVALALLLVLRLTLAPEPLEGLGGWLLMAAVPLALYAVWALASVAWSDAPARALTEFDRALLYLLALLVFGSLAGSPARLRTLVRGFALGAFVVCLAGLVTKLLPTVWATEASENARLDFPLTYEGAVGLVAVLGIVWCTYLATSHRQAALARVLGAAAVPILATTLLLTLSRAGIVALGVGVLGFVLVARPRALLPGLLATVPTAAVAVLVAYGEEALFEPVAVGAAPPGAPGVAVAVLLCSLGAALLRALLLPLDARLAAIEPSPRARRLTAATAVVLGLAAVAAALVIGLPAAIDRYERLAEADQAPQAEQDARGRLTEASGSIEARLDYWRVALDGFRDAPVKGGGAGTYATLWARERPASAAGEKVEDAHNVYLETLADLGVVGLLLLALALGTIVVGLLVRARGAARPLYGAVFAATAAWAVHAALDWDWEMPAVTLWLFAAGGAALSAGGRGEPLLPSPRLPARIAMVAAVLVLAATPALVALSQLHLHAAQDAAVDGDCAEAIDSALASISVLGIRPEPYETLGYCDLRVGAVALAPRAFERAIELDPDDWRYHYGLAIARAANGKDPRGAASRAERLNPRHAQTQELVRLFDTNDPRAWERRAEEARPALD